MAAESTFGRHVLEAVGQRVLANPDEEDKVDGHDSRD